MFKKTLTSNRSIALHRNYQNSLETATVITLTEITTKFQHHQPGKRVQALAQKMLSKLSRKAFILVIFILVI